LRYETEDKVLLYKILIKNNQMSISNLLAVTSNFLLIGNGQKFAGNEATSTGKTITSQHQLPFKRRSNIPGTNSGLQGSGQISRF
jgi:hypothetical protein